MPCGPRRTHIRGNEYQKPPDTLNPATTPHCSAVRPPDAGDPHRHAHSFPRIPVAQRFQPDPRARPRSEPAPREPAVSLQLVEIRDEPDPNGRHDQSPCHREPVYRPTTDAPRPP